MGLHKSVALVGLGGDFLYGSYMYMLWTIVHEFLLWLYVEPTYVEIIYEDTMNVDM